MARGWESKSVESQIEEAKSQSAVPSAPPLSGDEVRRRQEIATLELSRTRIIRELDATMNPRRQVQLRAALGHLNARLAELRG